MPRLPRLFSDNLVLQRGKPVPVWGWAEPGETITVSLDAKSATTVTGPDGRFLVKLPPLTAGGPFEMAIRGRETVTLRNILVGEVLFCSGQSNMEMRVEEAGNADQEIAAARYPGIRLFQVPRSAVVEPAMDVQASWQVCSPATIGKFSAAAYFCGRELHRRLRVPIGLINASVGATRLEAWASREALLCCPARRQEVMDYEKSLPDFEKRKAEHLAILAGGEEKYYPADPGNQGYGQGWADPAFDASGWGELPVPGIWNEHGLDFNGIVWYRKEIELPATWAGRDLELGLGACDKADIAYFNNVQVGAMGRENPDAWFTPRNYSVPGRLVKPGKNVIAVRIFSWAFDGGFRGPWDVMKLRPAGTRGGKTVPLWGTWQYKVEHNFGRTKVFRDLPPWGPGTANSPFALFNGMVRPVIPYAVRGVAWHQGTANLTCAFQYRELLPMLIRDWRRQWGDDKLWFHIVQQENYAPRDRLPQESAYAVLRESQLLGLKARRTTLVVASDIGGQDEVHPKNKQELGRRLALAVLAGIPGAGKLAYSGPVWKSCAIEPGKVRLYFDPADGGLKARRGELKGFAIAGRDRRFVWAKARIAGRTVIVWHPDVPRPRAVRYGWAANPDCRLYNKAGLPASPFRTDKWPVLTQKEMPL